MTVHLAAGITRDGRAIHLFRGFASDHVLHSQGSARARQKVVTAGLSMDSV